jgi:hypothetical protein
LLHSALYRLYEDGQKEALDARLAGEGQKVHEADVTKLLTILDGALERSVITAMCNQANVPYQDGFRLISGKEFNDDTGVKDRRAIDLVVINTLAPTGEVVREPILAIEAKFEGSVNGYWGYCPQHEGPERGYSNQIICYTHGCINPALAKDRVRFIWLGRPKADGVTMAMLKGAINDRDGDRYAAARALQNDAEKLWHSMTWDQLWTSIDDALDDKDASRSLLRALGAHELWAK